MSDTPSDSEQGSVAPAGATVPHRALRTRFCDLVGCRLPVVQTGMGWVSGASLTAATSAAGGFGILAAVTMTPDQFADAVRTVKQRTDTPVRRQLPSRPARPRRPHRPVRPRGRAPGQLRRCSHQGRHRPAARRRHPRHAHRRRPPPRREDARVGRRRRHRPGRRGRRPHRHGAHVAAAAPGGRRGGPRHPGARRRRLPRRPRPGRRAGLGGGRRGHGHPVPPHRREPRARRHQGPLPGGLGDRHGRHHRARRGAAAGHPHRDGRPARAVVARHPPARGRCDRHWSSARSPAPRCPTSSARASPCARART